MPQAPTKEREREREIFLPTTLSPILTPHLISELAMTATLLLNSLYVTHVGTD